MWVAKFFRVFENASQFRHCLSGDGTRFHRWKAQSHKAAPHSPVQTPVSSSRLLPVLLTDQLQVGRSSDLLRLICWSSSQYLGTHQHLTILWKDMIKHRNQQPVKGIHKVRSQSKELLSSWILGSGLVADGNLPVPQAWKLSKKGLKSALLYFNGGFTTLSWLSYRPRAESTSSSSPLPRSFGWGYWQLQPSNPTVGPPGNQPHPWVGSKSHLLDP